MGNRGSHKTISERISILIAKSPDKSILFMILVLNITFFMVAAFTISQLAPDSLVDRGFWPSVFYTVTMILDAGCISYVVENVGQTSVAVIIICLLIVLIGMITFTGAIVGYITNYISSFIEDSNAGKSKLRISGHVIILGWNSRGSEIITDYIYTRKEEDVVVLVRENKEDVLEEINNRIADTISTENRKVMEEIREKQLGYFERRSYLRKKRVRRNVSVIVREGDILSKAQLDNVSIDKAETIIILGKDYQTGKKYGMNEDPNIKHMKGNSNVIKTLIMVAEITGSEESANNQKVIVEVADEWTRELAQQVVENKEKRGKSNIILLPVNHTLGQLLSQVSIMPGLTQVYRELFSNKGAYFVSRPFNAPITDENVEQHFEDYLETHSRAIPVSVMPAKGGNVCFYLSDEQEDTKEVRVLDNKEIPVKLNPDYMIEKKNVIVLGHNSGMDALLKGFSAFRDEWNYTDGREVLNMVMIDDALSLETHNYYKEYPFVTGVIPAEIYDKELVYETLTKFSELHEGDICVLILSDDKVPNENIDEEPLTYLMYMDDILQRRRAEDPDFDMSRYNIIIEILNPQNYEAIQGYNPNHVIITNQYISRMIAQSSEHEAINVLYHDILTFDEPADGAYNSKELYLKRAEKFFTELPGECKVRELIYSIYKASPRENKEVLLGYFRDGKHVLFVGDKMDMKLQIRPSDRLILCSNH